MTPPPPPSSPPSPSPSPPTSTYLPPSLLPRRGAGEPRGDRAGAAAAEGLVGRAARLVGVAQVLEAGHDADLSLRLPPHHHHHHHHPSCSPSVPRRERRPPRALLGAGRPRDAGAALPGPRSLRRGGREHRLRSALRGAPRAHRGLRGPHRLPRRRPRGLLLPPRLPRATRPASAAATTTPSSPLGSSLRWGSPCSSRSSRCSPRRRASCCRSSARAGTSPPPPPPRRPAP